MSVLNTLTPEERANVSAYFKTSDDDIASEEWSVEQWNCFLSWVIETQNRPDLARTIFHKVKADVYPSFTSFANLRGNYGVGPLHRALYDNEVDFTNDLFGHITDATEMIIFIYSHKWEHIAKHQLVAKFTRVKVEPNDWLEVLDDRALDNVTDESLALMAAHWEASSLSFGEWRKVANNLHLTGTRVGYRSNDYDDPAEIPHYPEVILLMEIAQRKMHECIQSNNIFLSLHRQVRVR